MQNQSAARLISRKIFIQNARKRNLTAAASYIPPSSRYRPHSHKSYFEDQSLRQIFDSQPFWHDFSGPSRATWGSRSVGLFQNYHLRNPDGFRVFADVTIRKCQRIVTKILNISTLDDRRTIVKDFDRLSDLLCRVIDIADFVKSTHPKPAFQKAAAQAHFRMFEYMNTLNTTTGLNDQLKYALSDRRVTDTWTEQELKVAQILSKDFSQSAINLQAVQRQNFVDLSNDINRLGSQFLEHMRPESHSITYDRGRLRGLSPSVLDQYAHVRHAKVTLPSTGPAISHVLRYAEDEEVRKEAYLASRTASAQQIGVLESLLRARAHVARLSGFDSYGSMSLVDKMARTPTAVIKFLKALSRYNLSGIHRELSQLKQAKGKDSGSLAKSHTRIHAWDRDYYRTRLSEPLRQTSPFSDELSAYFSLGTVMQGLSRLFDRLYGVHFVPAEPLPGETWSSEVRKLNILDESSKHLAIVYCDLFSREGKSANPAHFTLRCSRLIPASEITESAQSLNLSRHDVSSTASVANDGMSTALQPDGSAYQLPTIALICDFPAAAKSYKPTLLPISQVVTLFHEMGHAIHSILGRTDLQNVSGTRCATDFAEIPSILMERFATNPAVLSLFARHWDTDAPLPEAYMKELQKRLIDNGDSPADTEWQIILALLDQEYHSSAPLKSDFSSDAVIHRIFRSEASVQEPESTRWQGFFGHLVGYGSTYYAYLFDRAIAAKIWEVVFDGGHGESALQRERGEVFKNEVLRWGGSRDPWKCVAAVLGQDVLADGGEAAMEEVGRWGVTGVTST